MQPGVAPGRNRHNFGPRRKNKHEALPGKRAPHCQAISHGKFREGVREIVLLLAMSDLWLASKNKELLPKAIVGLPCERSAGDYSREDKLFREAVLTFRPRCLPLLLAICNPWPWFDIFACLFVKHGRPQ